MEGPNERYDKEHQYGSVTFRLDNYWPDIEQCRYLILKVLEQADRDYTSLSSSQVPNERLQYRIAEAFLFEDEYYLWWGDKELKTEELLDIVDLDISWVREQTIRKLRVTRWIKQFVLVDGTMLKIKFVLLEEHTEF